MSAHRLLSRVVCCVVVFLLAAETPRDPIATRPLRRAHAHNDYYHARPLLDALSHGFCSVEADVFLVDGKLLVGHARRELKPTRTLEALYLDPLRERVRVGAGRVIRGGPRFTLLVDFKTEGVATYKALHAVLARYADLVMTVRGHRVERKPVEVIVSGNRAWETIAATSPRYVGVDGRLSDLASKRPAHLMPLVSDHWGRTFRWRGEGPMPAAEREKLRAIVKEAHAKGRRVRFWATPDRASPARTRLWAELVAAGVDHLNTDDLPGLAAFLRDTAPTPTPEPAPNAPNRPMPAPAKEPAIKDEVDTAAGCGFHGEGFPGTF